MLVHNHVSLCYLTKTGLKLQVVLLCLPFPAYIKGIKPYGLT